MKAFKLTSLFILILLLALGIWGFIIEPRFLLDVQIHDVEVPNLGSDWEEKKVALLADLQVGMWWGNTGMIKKAVRKAVEADPAMLLIAGDFIYKADSSVVKQAVLLLQPLVEAEIPVVAVFGNHDYSLVNENGEINEEIAAYLRSSLEDFGVVLLENESYSLTNDNGSTFHVIGLGSNWAGRSDIDKAFSKIPVNEPRVVFMHNPVVYKDIPADQGAFTLAAHTHGGQIHIPLMPASKTWLDIWNCNKKVDRRLSHIMLPIVVVLSAVQPAPVSGSPESNASAFGCTKFQYTKTGPFEFARSWLSGHQ